MREIVIMVAGEFGVKVKVLQVSAHATTFWTEGQRGRAYRCRDEQYSRPICAHCDDTESTEDMRVEMLNHFQRGNGLVAL